MYDNQVCKTGLGVCLVIGGTVITGWWVLGILLALVVVLLGIARVFFRRGQDRPVDGRHGRSDDHLNGDE